MLVDELGGSRCDAAARLVPHRAAVLSAAGVDHDEPRHDDAQLVLRRVLVTRVVDVRAAVVSDAARHARDQQRLVGVERQRRRLRVTVRYDTIRYDTIRDGV